MVDSEKVSSGRVSSEYQHTSPVGQFRTSAGKFTCDLLELAELQAKLLKADAKSVAERSIGAAIFVLVGCLSLLGCMPVLIFGAASAVAYFFEIDPWVSQLMVGGCLSVISIAVVAISSRMLSKTGVQFKRSTEEFSKNIEWLKDIFGSVSPKKQSCEGGKSND